MTDEGPLRYRAAPARGGTPRSRRGRGTLAERGERLSPGVQIPVRASTTLGS